jgi:hypothetical protein
MLTLEWNKNDIFNATNLQQEGLYSCVLYDYVCILSLRGRSFHH